MKLISYSCQMALVVSSFLLYARVWAIDIVDIRMDMVSAGQTRLYIETQTPPRVFTMDGGKPRIVIDVADGQLSKSLIDRTEGKNYFVGEAGIARLRFAVQKGGKLRLVADLVLGAQYEFHKYENGILEIFVSGNDGNAALLTSIQNRDGMPIPRLKPTNDFYNGIPVPRLKNTKSNRPIRKPVIVIDPGHGGHDPGAAGIAKLHEETVTLKAGLELRRQLLASGKYKVVMTRTTDKYIAHDKRVLIARKAGADLFISIHADSTGNADTRGASVYTLANRAEARTHKVINHQNWVLDVDLTKKSAPVSEILVDLAQRKTLTKSGQFADILIPELKKSSRLVGNTHRRAGYYVLLAPDVPAVLLEMGFLSNAQDEKLLKTPAHRKKLMKSVKAAIDQYFKVL